MNNKTLTNNEPANSTDFRQRRIDSSQKLLGLIDSAIRGAEAKTDWLKTAPTTVKVCRELDIAAKTPGYVKKSPPEIFTQYDPTAPVYGGAFLQKDLGRGVPFSPKTCEAMIAAGARLVEDAEIISEAERKTLLDIQAKMEQQRVQLASYTVSAANTEFFNQSHRKVAEALENGVLSESNIRTLDSIHHEFGTNRRAINEILLQLYHQTMPIVIKAHSKALGIVRAQMAFLENKEREEATAFALPWSPSFHWKACASIQSRIHPDRLRVAATSESAATPRESLEGIYAV